jgi:hypothetical protein
VWSRSGAELFYRHGRQYFSVPMTQNGESIQAGPPSLMFEGDYVITSLFPGAPSYDVAPDGQRFIAVKRASDIEQPQRIDVVVG